MEGSVTAAAGAASEDEYVNYLDIKLHQVLNLPLDWYESTSAATGNATTTAASATATATPVAGTAPAYNLHPFRYEVSMQWPSATARATLEAMPAAASTTATTGANANAVDSNSSVAAEKSVVSMSVSASKKSRKATAAPTATADVSVGDAEASSTLNATAVAAPQVASLATGSTSQPCQDIPLFHHGRMLSPLPSYTRYIDQSLPAAASGQGEDVRRLRDVPAAVEEAVVAAKEASQEAGVDDGTGANKAAAAATADGTAKPAAAPVLMWVCTASTSVVKDPSQSSAQAADGTAAARRRAKKGASGAASTVGLGGGAGSVLADAGATPPPPLPDAQDPPPCVVRIPLTAEAERYVQSLVRRGEPLVLTLHRKLKPGVPAEWEDLCAGYYAADMRVSLAALSEPGATSAHLRVPLTPLSDPSTGGEGKLPDGTLNSTLGQTAGSGVVAPVAATAGAPDQRRKKAAVRKAVKSGTVPALLCEEPDPSQPHPYLRAGTAAVVSLRVGTTLTRLPQDRIRPGITPMQLLPTRTAARDPRAVAAAAGMLDGGMGPFSDALESFAQQLFVDFTRFAQEQAQARPTEGLASGGGANGQSTRALFMAFVQSTGQLAAYKRQLVPLVARMVEQARATAVAAGPAQEVDVAKLTSDLYVALLDRTHQILRGVAQGEPGKANTHDTSDHQPNDASLGAKAKTTPRGAVGATGAEEARRGEDARDPSSPWSQRAEEAELVDDFATAEACLQARLSDTISRAGGNDVPAAAAAAAASFVAQQWVDLADLYCRWEREHAHKAEACYREALAQAPTHVTGLLHYGLFLLARHRVAEADVYLQCVVDAHPGMSLAWGCVCVLYAVKQLDAAGAARGVGAEKDAMDNERLYALRKAEEARAVATGSGSATQTASSAGELANVPVAATYVEVAQCALRLHHRGLVAIALAHTTTPSTSLPACWRAHTERLYAHLFFQGGQYEESLRAMQQCRAVAGNDKDDDDDDDEAADVLRAELTVLEAWCALGAAARVSHPAAGGAIAVPVPAHVVESLRRVLCLHHGGGRAPRGDDSAGAADHDAEAASAADVNRASVLCRSRGATATDGGEKAAPPSVVPEKWWLAAYVRLSNLLLASARYRDAQGVLVIALTRWPQCALLWLGAGTAYLRAGDCGAAEACLAEASRRDSWNPRTWALLALVHLYSGAGAHEVQGGCRPRHETAPSQVVVVAVHRALQNGLEDVALLGELGRMLLVGGCLALAEQSLRRALTVAQEGKAGSGKETSRQNGELASSVPSIRYHLAHVLMAAAKQSDEALTLLREVEADPTAAPALRARAQEDQHRFTEVLTDA